jgi:nucleoside-diphosphate-sugar epimerase
MPFSETIFLTGFPGFIAGRLVERLASGGGENTQIFLLVQPRLTQKAMEEVAVIAAKTGAPLENSFWSRATLPNQTWE